jgi:hypothetical protein
MWPCSALPCFRHEYTQYPSLVAPKPVESREPSSYGTKSVFERRVLVREVLHNEIEADMFEVIVAGVVTGVVAKGEIEAALGTGARISATIKSIETEETRTAKKPTYQCHTHNENR